MLLKVEYFVCLYLRRCRHVYVGQSARNGVLLNGPDSRTISPDALLDSAWLRFHLHCAAVGPDRKWSSHRRKTFDNMRSDRMHNECRTVLAALIVHLLTATPKLTSPIDPIQHSHATDVMSDMDTIEKCVFASTF